MKGHERQPADTTVSVEPELEERWQEALRSRPDNDNSLALTVWNRTHDDLIAEYQQAVAQAREKEERFQQEQAHAATARAKQRREIVVSVIVALLVISGVIYWLSRPSEDEVRREESLQREAACTAHYEQTHHVKLVTKQIDLLQDGEGGWVDLRPYTGANAVGGIDLSPAELQAGKTGEAHVDREDYVYSGPSGAFGSLLERHGSQLTLTLISDPSGFGDLPHAPLQVGTTSKVTVRGETIFPACW